MNYPDQLKHPKWQAKRLSVLKRDKFKCKKCGDEETTLHIHHLEYEKGKMAWEIENKKLVTLCRHCHLLVERFKQKWEFEQIKIIKPLIDKTLVAIILDNYVVVVVEELDNLTPNKQWVVLTKLQLDLIVQNFK